MLDSGQSRLRRDFRNDKRLIPSQIFSVVSLNSVLKNIAFLVILAFPYIEGFNSVPLRFGLGMANLRPSALMLVPLLLESIYSGIASHNCRLAMTIAAGFRVLVLLGPE